MAPTAGDSIPTRPSLLRRLQTGDDAQSWQEFYRTYGGLIRAFAFKAGLTEGNEGTEGTACLRSLRCLLLEALWVYRGAGSRYWSPGAVAEAEGVAAVAWACAAASWNRQTRMVTALGRCY